MRHYANSRRQNDSWQFAICASCWFLPTTKQTIREANRVGRAPDMMMFDLRAIGTLTCILGRVDWTRVSMGKALVPVDSIANAMSIKITAA